MIFICFAILKLQAALKHIKTFIRFLGFQKTYKLFHWVVIFERLSGAYPVNIGNYIICDLEDLSGPGNTFGILRHAFVDWT